MLGFPAQVYLCQSQAPLQLIIVQIFINVRIGGIGQDPQGYEEIREREKSITMTKRSSKIAKTYMVNRKEILSIKKPLIQDSKASYGGAWDENDGVNHKSLPDEHSHEYLNLGISVTPCLPS